MNPAIAYFRAFTDGNLDSFTTHIVLIGVIGVAEISLGIGIWLESPQDKKFREWFGLFLVLGGCIASVIFTVLLLIFDEGISRTQQSRIDGQQTIIESQNDKIVALLRIAPRILPAPDQIAQKLKSFAPLVAQVGTTNPLNHAFDIDSLGTQIAGLLALAQWKALAGAVWGTDDRPSGVWVSARESEAGAASAADMLVKELNAAGIIAHRDSKPFCWPEARASATTASALTIRGWRWERHGADGNHGRDGAR
jgi:hypothetical protein